MSTPNVTSAQILAIVTGAVGLFVGFGLIDNDHAQLVIGGAATIVPAVLILADSVIRHGRARVLAGPPQTTIVTADSPSSHVVPGEPQGVPDPGGDSE